MVRNSRRMLLSINELIIFATTNKEIITAKWYKYNDKLIDI